MFRNFFSALGNLTAAVNTLAASFTEANQRFRERLALDYHEEELPALPAPEDADKPARRNGRKATV